MKFQAWYIDKRKWNCQDVTDKHITVRSPNSDWFAGQFPSDIHILEIVTQFEYFSVILHRMKLIMKLVEITHKPVDIQQITWLTWMEEADRTQEAQINAHDPFQSV